MVGTVPPRYRSHCPVGFRLLSSFDYQIYGLRVRSNQPIAGLVGAPSELPPDVELWLDQLPAGSHPNIHPDSTGLVEVDGETLYLFEYADTTRIFTNTGGTRIWATIPRGATADDTLAYVLGPTLSFLLRLRGITALHASAVGVDGHAVALCGPAGAGKSTTAAAFSRRGVPVLCDDIVPLWPEGGRHLVYPGYAYLRLWPESAELLFGSRDALPPITPNWDKCYLSLAGSGPLFQHAALPLSTVYFLGQAERSSRAPFVEPVLPRDALVGLVANSYATDMLSPGMRSHELRTLSDLLRRVSVRRVVPHRDPARLADLCEVILADAKAVGSAAQDQG